MVEQPPIENPENSPAELLPPASPPPEPPTDHVSILRALTHCAAEYGLLAGGAVAVIITTTLIIRKMRKKK